MNNIPFLILFLLILIGNVICFNLYGKLLLLIQQQFFHSLDLLPPLFLLGFGCFGWEKQLIGAL